MLQITPQMRLLVAIEPVDFRKGIDGLVHLCKQSLGEDPLRGALFAFRNRRATAVKVLVYDGQGILALPEAAEHGPLSLVAKRCRSGCPVARRPSASGALVGRRSVGHQGGSRLAGRRRIAAGVPAGWCRGTALASTGHRSVRRCL